MEGVALEGLRRLCICEAGALAGCALARSGGCNYWEVHWRCCHVRGRARVALRRESACRVCMGLGIGVGGLGIGVSGVRVTMSRS